MNDTFFRKDNRQFRIQSGLLFVFVGLFLYILGVKPDWFGADRSPIVGFIQISVFLVGLAGICLGGYLSLNTLWNGMEKTIAADFGFRLVSTGYVISVASGMADVIGFGNQPSPAIPYFGPWQATGVMLGEFIIIVGLILLIPPPHRDHQKTT